MVDTRGVLRTRQIFFSQTMSHDKSMRCPGFMRCVFAGPMSSCRARMLPASRLMWAHSLSMDLLSALQAALLETLAKLALPACICQWVIAF